MLQKFIENKILAYLYPVVEDPLQQIIITAIRATIKHGSSKIIKDKDKVLKVLPVTQYTQAYKIPSDEKDTFGIFFLNDELKPALLNEAAVILFNTGRLVYAFQQAMINHADVVRYITGTSQVKRRNDTLEHKQERSKHSTDFIEETMDSNGQSPTFGQLAQADSKPYITSIDACKTLYFELCGIDDVNIQNTVTIWRKNIAYCINNFYDRLNLGAWEEKWLNQISSGGGMNADAMLKMAKAQELQKNLAQQENSGTESTEQQAN